ncbi:MAG: HNH endonuclease [Syntrophorhabdus sp. PtaU1.Bin153]|nr:MAG: HNH endonuclease [Syntrophorhabdus sp. PtaU1.Bin153]
MSHPWYHTSRWRKRRARQIVEHPLCAMCEQQGRVTAATIADHVVPHRGDAEKFWNGELQSLCATCHSARKQMQEKHGYSQGCDVDGNPTDDQHPWNRGKK